LTLRLETDVESFARVQVAFRELSVGNGVAAAISNLHYLRSDEPLAGYDRIYVDDPFGNRIELLEPLLR
jgi:hypothetical protein